MYKYVESLKNKSISLSEFITHSIQQHFMYSMPNTRLQSKPLGNQQACTERDPKGIP